ncbi:MAG: ribonuclease H-like domain-containing protein [Candidatus Woesearchaeota archaeon]
MAHFIFDIETAPVQIQTYHSLDEQEQRELLNPIDSKIVAVGIYFNEETFIFDDDDEKQLLRQFWSKWDECVRVGAHPVGFNSAQFDLPFLTARSFILGVQITPFILKHTIDLREKIHAFRYGPTRGKLKEFAQLIGFDVTEDGSMVAQWHKEGKKDIIRSYLQKDLELTNALYLRAQETNILQIQRW